MDALCAPEICREAIVPEGGEVNFTTEHKIKWMARFFKTIIEKVLRWEVVTMEEDGGAWDLNKQSGDTLEEAIEKAWVFRKMDKRVAGVLAYRDMNYRNETDEQLGIAPERESEK